MWIRRCLLLGIGALACSPAQRNIASTGAGAASTSSSSTVASSSGGKGGAGTGGGSPSSASSGGATASGGASSSSATASTTTTSSSTGGPAFKPTDLTGLAVWLDGAVGVSYDSGGHVIAWTDQSGNSNDAAPSSCTGPVRAAASLNGRDTLVFDGAADCLRIGDAATVQFGSGDFAVFVVLRYTNQPVFGQPNAIASLWAKRLTASPYTGVSVFGNTISPADTAELELRQDNVVGNIADSATATLNDGKYRRLGAARRGTTLEVYVNGAVDGTQAITPIDVDTVGRPVWIGGEPDQGVNGTNWMAGNVAEVVAVKGTVSDAQVASLDAYLKAKYGL